MVKDWPKLVEDSSKNNFGKAPTRVCVIAESGNWAPHPCWPIDPLVWPSGGGGSYLEVVEINPTPPSPTLRKSLCSQTSSSSRRTSENHRKYTRKTSQQSSRKPSLVLQEDSAATLATCRNLHRQVCPCSNLCHEVPSVDFAASLSMSHSRL